MSTPNIQAYRSELQRSAQEAHAYNHTNECPARYLAYRDIPAFIKKYVVGKHALDLGSGTGISTQFLIKQGLEVEGADISQNMLQEAQKNCPKTSFYFMENGLLPTPSQHYDLVFSSFVLLEIGSKEALEKYLMEAKRSLKKGGILIVVTGSSEMYSKTWLSYKTDYSCNKKLKSGDLAKLFLPSANIEFSDYYWREEDYKELLQKASLHIIEEHNPLGQPSESYPWQDELVCSPFVIFVARAI